MRSYEQRNLGRSRTALVDYEEMHNDETQSRGAASRGTSNAAPAAPTVPTVTVVEYLFSVAAVTLAAIYAGAFLWTFFLSDYFASAADASMPLWMVGDSPQTGIALCLIFAAAFLSLWKGTGGNALALATYLFIAWQFYYWFDLTGQVKTNAGKEVINGTGWLGSRLYGAGLLDGLTLLAVFAFISLSAYLLVQKVAVSVNAQREEATPSPFIERVNGYDARHNGYGTRHR